MIEDPKKQAQVVKRPERAGQGTVGSLTQTIMNAVASDDPVARSGAIQEGYGMMAQIRQGHPDARIRRWAGNMQRELQREGARRGGHLAKIDDNVNAAYTNWRDAAQKADEAEGRMNISVSLGSVSADPILPNDADKAAVAGRNEGYQKYRAALNEQAYLNRDLQGLYHSEPRTSMLQALNPLHRRTPDGFRQDAKPSGHGWNDKTNFIVDEDIFDMDALHNDQAFKYRLSALQGPVVKKGDKTFIDTPYGQIDISKESDQFNKPEVREEIRKAMLGIDENNMAMQQGMLSNELAERIAVATASAIGGQDLKQFTRGFQWDVRGADPEVMFPRLPNLYGEEEGAGWRSFAALQDPSSFRAVMGVVEDLQDTGGLRRTGMEVFAGQAVGAAEFIALAAVGEAAVGAAAKGLSLSKAARMGSLAERMPILPWMARTGESLSKVYGYGKPYYRGLQFGARDIAEEAMYGSVQGALDPNISLAEGTMGGISEGMWEAILGSGFRFARTTAWKGVSPLLAPKALRLGETEMGGKTVDYWMDRLRGLPSQRVDLQRMIGGDFANARYAQHSLHMLDAAFVGASFGGYEAAISQLGIEEWDRLSWDEKALQISMNMASPEALGNVASFTSMGAMYAGIDKYGLSEQSKAMNAHEDKLVKGISREMIHELQNPDNWAQWKEYAQLYDALRRENPDILGDTPRVLSPLEKTARADDNFEEYSHWLRLRDEGRVHDWARQMATPEEDLAKMRDDWVPVVVKDFEANHKGKTSKPVYRTSNPGEHRVRLLMHKTAPFSVKIITEFGQPVFGIVHKGDPTKPVQRTQLWSTLEGAMNQASKLVKSDGGDGSAPATKQDGPPKHGPEHTGQSGMPLQPNDPTDEGWKFEDVESPGGNKGKQQGLYGIDPAGPEDLGVVDLGETVAPKPKQAGLPLDEGVANPAETQPGKPLAEETRHLRESSPRVRQERMWFDAGEALVKRANSGEVINPLSIQTAREQLLRSDEPANHALAETLGAIEGSAALPSEATLDTPERDSATRKQALDPQTANTSIEDGPKQAIAQERREIVSEPPVAPKSTLEVTPEAQQQVAADNTIRVEEVMNAMNAGAAEVNVSELELNPDLFQHKAGTEQGTGVDPKSPLTTAGVWNKAGERAIIVFEYKDGRKVVADGHQRTAFAKRINKKTVPALVLREADGLTEEHAAVAAGLVNMLYGTAKPADIAKVFRSAELTDDEIRQFGIDPLRADARNAQGLAKLTPEVFGMVEAGKLPEVYGAEIGHALHHQPQIQLHAAQAVIKGNLRNRDQVRFLAQHMAADAVVSSTQASLFGDIEEHVSLYTFKAEVGDYLAKRAKREKGAFGALAKNAAFAEKIQGHINVAAAKGEHGDLGSVIEAINTLGASKGTAINGIITKAAERIAAGEDRKATLDTAWTELREADFLADADFARQQDPVSPDQGSLFAGDSGGRVETAKKPLVIEKKPIARAPLKGTPGYIAMAERMSPLAKDKDGNPFTLYHGTGAAIDSFDTDKNGASDGGYFSAGTHLTPSRKLASSYAETSGRMDGGKPQVYILYLDVQNPYVYKSDPAVEKDAAARGEIASAKYLKDGGDPLDPGFRASYALARREAIQAAGYDSEIVPAELNRAGDNETEFIAFKPEQLKSALGNKGTYEQGNSDIRSRSAKSVNTPAELRTKKTGQALIFGGEEEIVIEGSRVDIPEAHAEAQIGLYDEEGGFFEDDAAARDQGNEARDKGFEHFPKILEDLNAGRRVIYLSPGPPTDLQQDLEKNGIDYVDLHGKKPRKSDNAKVILAPSREVAEMISLEGSWAIHDPSGNIVERAFEPKAEGPAEGAPSGVQYLEGATYVEDGDHLVISGVDIAWVKANVTSRAVMGSKGTVVVSNEYRSRVEAMTTPPVAAASSLSAEDERLAAEKAEQADPQLFKGPVPARAAKGEAWRTDMDKLPPFASEQMEDMVRSLHMTAQEREALGDVAEWWSSMSPSKRKRAGREKMLEKLRRLNSYKSKANAVRGDKPDQLRNLLALAVRDARRLDWAWAELESAEIYGGTAREYPNHFVIMDIELGNNDAKIADADAKGIPDEATSTREIVEFAGDPLVTFSSGLGSAPADIQHEIAAGRDPGVSLAEGALSSTVKKALIDHLNSGGRVFMDSGAFTEFTTGESVDWQGVFRAYREILEGTDRNKRRNLYIVAPDKVGSLWGTADRRLELDGLFRNLSRDGARIIYSVQLDENAGPSGQPSMFEETNKLFDNIQLDLDDGDPDQPTYWSSGNAVVGIPFNEASWSEADVVRFVKKQKRSGDFDPYIHLLGGGHAKLQSLAAALRAEGLENSVGGLTSDARPKIVSDRMRGKGKVAREENATQQLKEESDARLRRALKLEAANVPPPSSLEVSSLRDDYAIDRLKAEPDAPTATRAAQAGASAKLLTDILDKAGINAGSFQTSHAAFEVVMMLANEDQRALQIFQQSAGFDNVNAATSAYDEAVGHARNYLSFMQLTALSAARAAEGPVMTDIITAYFHAREDYTKTGEYTKATKAALERHNMLGDNGSFMREGVDLALHQWLGEAMRQSQTDGQLPMYFGIPSHIFSGPTMQDEFGVRAFPVSWGRMKALYDSMAAKMPKFWRWGVIESSEKIGRPWAAVGIPRAVQEINYRGTNEVLRPAQGKQVQFTVQTAQLVEELTFLSAPLPRNVARRIPGIIRSGMLKTVRSPEDFGRAIGGEQFAYLYSVLKQYTEHATSVGRDLRDLGFITGEQFLAHRDRYMMRETLKAERKTLEQKMREGNFSGMLVARDLSSSDTAKQDMAMSILNPEYLMMKGMTQEAQVRMIMEVLQDLVSRGVAISYEQLHAKRSDGSPVWDGYTRQFFEVGAVAINVNHVEYDHGQGKMDAQRDPVHKGPVKGRQALLHAFLGNMRRLMADKGVEAKGNQHPWTAEKAKMLNHWLGRDVKAESRVLRRAAKEARKNKNEPLRKSLMIEAKAVAAIDPDPGMVISRQMGMELETILRDMMETSAATQSALIGSDSALARGVLSEHWAKRVDEMSRWWRRAKTVQNPVHWTLSRVSDVVTNYVVADVPLMDFASSVILGKGAYADSWRNLLWWQRWAELGSPQAGKDGAMPEALKAEGWKANQWEAVQEVQEATEFLVGSTFVDTLVKSNAIGDILGATVTPDEQTYRLRAELKERRAMGEGGEATSLLGDAVSDLGRRMAAGQARQDRAVIELWGKGDSQSKVDAIAGWTAQYQLWELAAKYTASISLRRRNVGMSFKQSLIYGARGTADYANTSPWLRRFSTAFNYSKGKGWDDIEKSPGLKRFARAATASPFWLYKSAMTPDLLQSAVRRPHKVLVLLALMNAMQQGIRSVWADRPEEEESYLRGMSLSRESGGSPLLSHEEALYLSEKVGLNRLWVAAGGNMSSDSAEKISNWFLGMLTLSPQKFRAPRTHMGETRSTDIGELSGSAGLALDAASAMRDSAGQSTREQAQNIIETLNGFIPTLIGGAVTGVIDVAYPKRGETRIESGAKNALRFSAGFMPGFHPETYIGSNKGQLWFQLSALEGQPIPDYIKGRVQSSILPARERIAAGAMGTLWKSRRVIAKDGVRDEQGLGRAILNQMSGKLGVDPTSDEGRVYAGATRKVADQFFQLLEASHDEWRDYEFEAPNSLDMLIAPRVDITADLDREKLKSGIYALKEGGLTSGLGTFIARQPAGEQSILIESAMGFLDGPAWEGMGRGLVLEAGRQRKFESMAWTAMYRAAVFDQNGRGMLTLLHRDIVQRNERGTLADTYPFFLEITPPKSGADRTKWDQLREIYKPWEGLAGKSEGKVPPAKVFGSFGPEVGERGEYLLTGPGAMRELKKPK